MFIWHTIQHWLAIHAGIIVPGASPNSQYLNFWQGVGADIPELALPFAVYAFLRKHDCHYKGCWRMGRHVVDGSPWCNKHHEKARKDLDERQRTPE